MPIQMSNVLGPLIDNPSVLPDATVQTPFVNSTPALGTTQETAAPLTGEITLIPNNTTANGVILPVGLKGQRMFLYPQLATNAPKVYPPVGGTINGGAVNANGTAAAQVMKYYICVSDDGLQWIST